MFTSNVSHVSCLVLAALMAFAWPGRCLGDSENLLANSGFEVDSNNDGQPDGWDFAWEFTHSGDDPKVQKKQKPDYGLDEKVVHSGKRSVRIAVSRREDDGLYRQVVTRLVPGTKLYRLSAWVKTEGVANGDARVIAAYYGSAPGSKAPAEKKWLAADYNAIRVSKDSDWQFLCALLEPPPGTADIRIALWVNFNYAGPCKAWFDDLSLTATDLQETPPLTHLDGRAMPALTDEEKRRGYVAFATNYLDMIFPDTVPTREQMGRRRGVSELPNSETPLAREQMSRPLAAFAALGEYEPMSFAVRALKDLGDVTATVSPLKGPGGAEIPPSSLDLLFVRCLMKKPHYSINHQMLVPAFLEKRDKVALKADTTLWAWLTVRVPENAKAGKYRGAVTLRPERAEAQALPIEFEVLPFKLVEPKGVAFGMYDKAKSYDPRPEDLLERFRDQREHGMTSVGFCGPLGAAIAFEDGKAKIDWKGEGDLERAMDAYLRAGFPEPFHWLMGGDVGRAALKGTTLQSPEFEARYRAAIEAILAHAKSENWPPIVFQPVDEGFEHRDRFEEMVRCMAIMKKIPGVVVEADGMNGNPAGLEDVMHLIDVFNYHDGPHLKRTVYDGPAWEAFMDRLDREGKTMWFYNIDTTAYHPEIMRFGYGFHLIRCRAKGSFCWAYQWGGKDPYVDPPGRGFNFMFRFPPFGSETGGPSTGWEGTREGVDDYRYYATYQAAADRARKRGDAAALKLIVQTDAALKAALDKIEYSNWRKPGHQGEWTGGERITPDCRRAVVGQYKLPNGWTFDDYDRLRRLLAYAILALQQGGL